MSSQILHLLNFFIICIFHDYYLKPNIVKSKDQLEKDETPSGCIILLLSFILVFQYIFISINRLLKYFSISQHIRMKLSTQIQTDQQLLNHFSNNNNRYISSTQLALYSTPTQKQKQYLKNAGFDKSGDPVFLIFGMHQEANSDKLQRVYLIMIGWFEKQFELINKEKGEVEKFTVVFYNSLCESSVYSTFKEMYKDLPVKYFDNLKRIIVIQAGFTNITKGWISGGVINNYLYTLTYHISQTNQLQKYDIAVNSEFRKLIPFQIRQHENSKFSWFCSSTQNLLNEQKTLNSGKNILQQIDIKTKSHNFYKSELKEYDLNDKNVVIVLILLTDRLKNNPSMLEVEGIFRKCVAIDEKEEANDHLSCKDYSYINKIDNPYLISSIILNIFASLEEPIFPVNVYKKLASNKSQVIDEQYLSKIVSELPRINQINLHYLLNFMKTHVVSKCQKNLATAYNIAVVLTPGLMRSHNCVEDIVNIKKCVKIMEFMINNCEKIFCHMLNKEYHSPQKVFQYPELDLDDVPQVKEVKAKFNLRRDNRKTEKESLYDLN